MTDICQMNRDGIRTIALSQELVGRTQMKLFTYGDLVMLESDNPQCSGIWQVEDTMNARYIKRGDLFQPTRATNTSCTANIYKMK